MQIKVRLIWIFIFISLFILYFAAIITGYAKIGDVISPVIAFLAFSCVCKTVRESGYQPRWAILSMIPFSWAIVYTLRAVYSLGLHKNPETSIILTSIYILPNLAILLTVLLFAVFHRKRWETMIFFLDAGSIFVSLAVFVYAVFFYNRLFLIFEQDYINIAFLSYFVMNLVSLPVAFSISFLLPAEKKSFAARCLLSAIILYTVSNGLYVYRIFNDTNIPGYYADTASVFSILFFGISGFLYRQTSSDIAGGYNTHQKLLSSDKLSFKSTLLLVAILILSIVEGIYVDIFIIFVIIIFIHQIIGLIIRRLIRKQNELVIKSKHADLLKSRMIERTAELTKINKTLEDLVNHDPVTEQYNRKYFLDKTDEWIAGSDKDDRIWMIILDFDRFKSVNDTYGHDTGDMVLRIIGSRLANIINERIVLARLGGDEFGILCRMKADDNINPAVDSVVELLTRPVVFEEKIIHLTVSAGVAVFPDDGRTRSDLMRYADMAMYRSKSHKFSRISFHDPLISAQINRKHQLDISLRDANIYEEFEIYYQPQFKAVSRQLSGMEALLRWNSKKLGKIPPDEFIPVAEENGLILELTEWVMRNALMQIKNWNEQYFVNLRMGINISPVLMENQKFYSNITGLLEETEARPEWINLEITEGSAIKGERFISEILEKLAKLKISLSIDDFGTGYSSLSYLQKFNIDYLKIAKQLIDGISYKKADSQIVNAIILVAKAMDITTIAEGVEDEQQLGILEALGCDEIQGFYLGIPSPAHVFEKLFLQKKQSFYNY